MGTYANSKFYQRFFSDSSDLNALHRRGFTFLLSTVERARYSNEELDSSLTRS
jgi:hypothetical protein